MDPDDVEMVKCDDEDDYDTEKVLISTCINNILYILIHIFLI